MGFKSLEEALGASDSKFDYHFVRLFTGTWVRVEGEPVGIRVRRIERNVWHQVI